MHDTNPESCSIPPGLERHIRTQAMSSFVIIASPSKRRRVLRRIVLFQPRDVARRRNLRVLNHLRNSSVPKSILKRGILEQRAFHLVFFARSLVVRETPRGIHHDGIEVECGRVVADSAALVLRVLGAQEAVFVGEGCVVAEAGVDLVGGEGGVGGLGGCCGVGVALEVGAGVEDVFVAWTC